MRKIFFYTPTLLSHIDLMSMGGSDKANDDATLGMYNSGLKFAIALFMRNNVDINIRVLDNTFSDNHNRNRSTFYSFHSYTEYCEQTNKEKELITINKNVCLESFFSVHCEDLGGGDLETEIINTGFSTNLGVDWKLWMAMREIFSNMIDEDGYYKEEPDDTFKYGTTVELSFEDDSEFAEIWDTRHLYINEQTPLYEISDKVAALKNNEGYLRIYKQNILVYEDKKVPSKFAYSIKFGTIDEKRILCDLYNVESEIISAIRYTSNEQFLREIVTKEYIFLENEFLSNCSCYGTAKDLIHDIAYEIYNDHGEVNSYGWLLNSIKERKDCKIGGKKIKSIGDSLWCYSTTVVVDSIPESLSEPNIEFENKDYVNPFSAEIKKYYNFDLDIEVKKAKLKGSKCIADKFNKCLIVDEGFNIEVDFPSLLVQYIDLTVEGNVVRNLSEYTCKLLKKEI